MEAAFIEGRGTVLMEDQQQACVAKAVSKVMASCYGRDDLVTTVQRGCPHASVCGRWTTRTAARS